MLRIVTEQRGDEYTLSLYGKLADEWVPELERCWSAIVDSVPTARVVVVLSDVSFIDAEGERLLALMLARRTRLVATGCMNSYVLEKVRSRAGAGAPARPPSGTRRQQR